MKYLTQITTGRTTRLLGACALLAGGFGSAALLAAGAASAATCSPTVLTETTCTMVGTADLTGGNLSLTAPATLSWTDTLNGAAQTAVDTITGDQSYGVDDASGTAAGWHVNASATQFASLTVPADTLPADTTLFTNGSITDPTAATAPDTACVVIATPVTCSAPTNTTTYPAAIDATAAPIFNAAIGTGVGSMIIGATVPVGWWINIPADATAEPDYTSTITLDIVTAP
jgi:hypothetical protein